MVDGVGKILDHLRSGSGPTTNTGTRAILSISQYIGPTSSTNCKQLYGLELRLAALIQSIIDEGVLVVVASGNNNEVSQTP